MRMRVAGAHHRAPIFENLHIPDPRLRLEIDRLLAPGFYNALDCAAIHLRQRQIVARRKADYAADPTLALRNEEAVIVEQAMLRIRNERRKIVIEHEGGLIRGVPNASGPFIAGTQVA